MVSGPPPGPILGNRSDTYCRTRRAGHRLTESNRSRRRLLQTVSGETVKNCTEWHGVGGNKQGSWQSSLASPVGAPMAHLCGAAAPPVFPILVKMGKTPTVYGVCLLHGPVKLDQRQARACPCRAAPSSLRGPGGFCAKTHLLGQTVRSGASCWSVPAPCTHYAKAKQPVPVCLPRL